MKEKIILKEAGVLLIGALLIFSSVAVMATKTDNTKINTPSCEINFPIRNSLPSHLQDNVILWDNFCLTWKSGYHCQDDPPDEPKQWDSFVADDFLFDEETEVNWVFWQFVYWNCNIAGGPKDFHYDWNVTFFEDEGTGYHPGDIFAGPFTIADAEIHKSRPYANSSIYSGGYWNCGAYAFLPEPVTFNADTKYWISIYSIGPIYPQSGWYVHNESHGGILLHEGNRKSEHWGWPDWTNFSIVDADGESLDANFVLGGEPPFEVKIKKGLGVTVKITNNLPEGVEGLVHNMTVNITATGGFVLNPIRNTLVNEFAGQTTVIIRWYPIGFGGITIDVDCTAQDVGIGSAEKTGFLILFFVI